MGTNNFSTKNPGDVISSADPNQYKTGLDENVVPRNTSGIPTDIAGGLGTTLYRWATSYIKRIYLGTAAEEVWIDGTGTVFRMGIGTVTKMLVGTAGIDGTYAKVASWLFSMFSSGQEPTLRYQDFTAAGTYSFVVPSYAGSTGAIGAMLVGGGGGGGGGAGYLGAASGSGGGGGGGGVPIVTFLRAVADETLTVIVGAAGGGGNGGSGGGGGAGTAGSAGGQSSIYRSSTLLIRALGGQGGSGGGGAGTASAAGPGGTGLFTVVGQRTSGGAGAVANTGAASSNGEADQYADAGVGCASNNGGSGGGGGAGLQAGGNGGNSVDANKTAGGIGGGGGGGGGGEASGSSNGYAGASGGLGRVIIFWSGKL